MASDGVGSGGASPAAAAPLVAPPEVEARFAAYYNATLQGHNFTQSLRSRKAFGNPYILEEISKAYGLNQWGSAGFQDQLEQLQGVSYIDLANRQESVASGEGSGARSSIAFSAPQVSAPAQLPGGLQPPARRGAQ